MSGYFSRAWDNGAKIDPDANSRTALNNGKVKGNWQTLSANDCFNEFIKSYKEKNIQSFER